jgi:acyl carrier protein
MSKSAIQEYILEKMKGKMQLFGLQKNEVNADFDLVKSGLLDSMAFVDLVADLEEKFDVEVDFEKVAEQDDFTRVGGLTELINDARNAK